MNNYRKIVEDSIGRKLSFSEIIHHKDGNQHNNSPNNLEITDGREHRKKQHLTSRDWELVVKRLIRDERINIGETLNNNLSLFFTERQKEIIYRKIYGLPLSKTEKEYFSREIRKKLVGLANPALHQICIGIVCA